MAEIPLLVIAGPTASGKTSVAIEVALTIGGEIISADSMQVYKYMDIGTAKATPEQRALVPHHLLDVVEPHEEYSLADHQKQAVAAAKDIYNRGRLPLLVGGTGLYIRAVVDNYPLQDIPHNEDCRRWLQGQWLVRGQERMRQWLEAVDPFSAARIACNDQRRAIRALEVWLLAGRSLGEIQQEAKKKSPFRTISFALFHPREHLYNLIDERTLEMINSGLVGEYMQLTARGYSPHCKSMQGLGYRHAGMYIQGHWDLAKMTAELQQDTRRYAKRQLTWFRGIPDMQWLENINPQETSTTICHAIAGKFNSLSE